ncbi:HalOD1 output domain-containing protein [Halomicrococcus sp. SG-WS-1]|uniref:HalOD1 output domain-containing protein n=1 Tax=Halomicrococcus sp. SG-WS-1 TaxID=3439057 RepID=UPI003F7A8B54
MNGVDRGYSDGGGTPTRLSGESPAYHVYHDDSRSISETVIDAVAAIQNLDPTEARIPLDEVVDPDALDAIFADSFDGQTRDGGRVVFSVAGLDVFVHANRHIFIRE